MNNLILNYFILVRLMVDPGTLVTHIHTYSTCFWRGARKPTHTTGKTFMLMGEHSAPDRQLNWGSYHGLWDSNATSLHCINLSALKIIHVLYHYNVSILHNLHQSEICPVSPSHTVQATVFSCYCVVCYLLIGGACYSNTRNALFLSTLYPEDIL